VGFPRPKRKGRCRDACHFTTGQIKVLADRKHVQLPRIGVIRTHESTRKLSRRLEHGTARILAGTISRTADRWFISFTVEAQRHVESGSAKATVVGVDVGVRHLAVLSTGMVIPNPGPGTLAAEAPSAQPATPPPQARLNTQTSDPAATGPGPRQRGQSPPRRPPQAHHRLGHRARHRGGGAAQRGRDGPQPPPCPGPFGCRPGRAAPAAHLQDQLVRQPFDRRRPLLSLIQDVLSLRVGESQAHPGRAHLHLRGLRAGPRPRPECRPQPREARGVRRQSGWETKNARGADRKTQPAGQVATKREPSSPGSPRA
jgi:hypothetical protein